LINFTKGKIELKQFQPGASIEGIVSVASNASYFFLQLIDQRKDEFDLLSKNLQYVVLFSTFKFLFYLPINSEYYSNLDKNYHYHPLPGDYCVAMYTEDARWYRSRIIRYISGLFIHLFFQSISYK
jgi:hypothetical protein